MIERTFDAAFFNRIVNLPDVRPYMGGGDGELDVTAVVTNPLNFALRTEHGGFILQAAGAGFYSVHTQFAAEGRGQHAIQAMKAGLDFMFTRTDAMRISSFCPDNNPAAYAFSQVGDARGWFRRTDAELGPGTVVSWEIFDWAANTPELEDEGELFHDLLETSKSHADSPLPAHEDDPAHNRVVGAVCLMARRGNIRKGVILYNLWAAAAGYQSIELLSENPPVVDVRDGIMTVNSEGEMECLLARQ